MSKTIVISDAAFFRLARWASVGRTIDAAMDHLNTSEEGGAVVYEELYDLKQALCDVESGVREAWFSWTAEQQAAAFTTGKVPPLGCPTDSLNLVIKPDADASADADADANANANANASTGQNRERQT